MGEPIKSIWGNNQWTWGDWMNWGRTINVNKTDQVWKYHNIHDNGGDYFTINGRPINRDIVTYNPFYSKEIDDTVYIHPNRTYYIRTPYRTELNKRQGRYFRELIDNRRKYQIAPSNTVITLRNAGRASGARVNPNLLDSIALNAGKESYPIDKALGLAIKESTLMPAADDIVKLYSDWDYESQGPYQSDLVEVYKIGRGFPNPDEQLGEVVDDKKIDGRARDYAHSLKTPYKGPKDESPIRHAIRKYKTAPQSYNSGQGQNYHDLVNENAIQIMRSPQIKKWWNTSGNYWYNKGLQSKKKGGILKYKGDKKIDTKYLPWVPNVRPEDVEGEEYPEFTAGAMIGARYFRALNEALDNIKYNPNGQLRCLQDKIGKGVGVPVIIEKLGGKINKFKSGGYVRKMQTGDPLVLVNGSTRVEKPIIITPKKINKLQLLDDNFLQEKTNDDEINTYPNLRNDRWIQEFFQYDYAPRFKRQNNFALQNYVNAAQNIYKNTPINIYNEDNNISGYTTKSERKTYNNYLANLVNSSYVSPSIYLNKKFKMNRPNLVHELTHAFRQEHLGISGDTRFSSVKYPIYSLANSEIGNGYSGSGYSNSEKNILNNTYNMKGFKIDYDPLYEKGTTNTEVRFKLWKQLYNKLGRRPSLKETDEYIKTYDGKKLQEMIRNINGYGNTMYNNGILINQVKNALINVAQNDNKDTYQLKTYYS